MADNSRAVAAMMVGAAIGACAGFIFFTDRGRALRRQLEPALEELTRELGQFRVTVNKAAGVASEGWKLLHEAIGDRELPASRYPTTQQTSPF